MKKVELQYKTFDELMVDVLVDFKNYDMEGMINPQELIRVATKVNYDLGIQITREKDGIVDICNNQGRLPSDFLLLNYAYLCGSYSVTEMVPSGTHIEDVILTPPDCKNPKIYYYAYDYSPDASDLCANNCFQNNIGRDNYFGLASYTPLVDGDVVYIQYSANVGLCVTIVGTAIQQISDPRNPPHVVPNWRVYSVLQKHSDCAECRQTHNQFNIIPESCGDPIQNVTPQIVEPNDSPFCMPQDACMTKCGDYYQLIQKVKYSTKTYQEFLPIHIKPGKYVDCNCPNNKVMNGPFAEIKNGFVMSGFENGTLYINYQASMQDDDGNLLVLDHPMITEYYEYAIKERLLENLIMNGETGMENKISYIAGKLRIARINALSIVRTPNYADMKAVWAANRQGMYRRYYDIIN